MSQQGAVLGVARDDHALPAFSPLEHLVVYLRFPKEHWHRIRHSNFIERTFGETRRRVKVIGRLPGERSCLTLVWAVLGRASRGWRGVEMTPKTRPPPPTTPPRTTRPATAPGHPRPSGRPDRCSYRCQAACGRERPSSHSW